MTRARSTRWLVGAGALGAALVGLVRHAAAGRNAFGGAGPAFAAGAVLRADELLAFGRPVPRDVAAIVSSGWSALRGERLHRALDLPLPVGTPVLAVDRGVVVRVDRDGRSAAGRWIGILHASGITSRYLHLSRIDVAPGAVVARGQIVGRSGDTGDSAAPHLHLDLRAPAYLLPLIARRIGAPRGGWGPNLEPYGHSIPGEPWIPVDGYRERVRRAAAAAGIPLYGEVPRE